MREYLPCSESQPWRFQGLDPKGDGLSRESFDENLLTTAETQDEMEPGKLTPFGYCNPTECPSFLKLLVGKDETLLIRADTKGKDKGIAFC